MTLQIFTVFDSAANLFLQPFFAMTAEVAIRQFRELVNDTQHQFGKFPEDYTLFHIGEVDQETGQILSMEPRSLGIAITFQSNGAPVERLELKPASLEGAHA